jgi:hypothetical protein
VAVGKNEGLPQALGFPFPRLDSLPAVTTEGAWYNQQSQNWLAAWSGAAAASLLWLERTQVHADHAEQGRAVRVLSEGGFALGNQPGLRGEVLAYPAATHVANSQSAPAAD